MRRKTRESVRLTRSTVYLPGMRIRVQIPIYHIKLSGYSSLPEIPGTKLACQMKQCTEFQFQQETLLQYIMDGTVKGGATQCRL